MARLEWAEGGHSVKIIKEDEQFQIHVGDCINFTNHIKNRSGKVIHRKTIRAEIKRFEGGDDITIVVRKLGEMKGNMENIGEEITIVPDSYESITHDGCAFRRTGGSRRRVTRRRRRRQAHKPN